MQYRRLPAERKTNPGNEYQQRHGNGAEKTDARRESRASVFLDKPDLHRHKGKEQKRLRVREKYDTNESRDKGYITFGRDKA